MPTLSFGRNVQLVVRAYLAVMFASLCATGALMVRSGRNWGYGDWLINYQGGFVRRGFTGEVCFQVGRLLHVDPIVVVAAIGITCYAVLFWCVWQLLRESSWRWWVVGLMVSPATLAFPVISRTSFRKEILLFALLAALAVWLLKHAQQAGSDVKIAAVLTIALPAIILCHEPLVAYFPYIAAALLIAIGSPARVLRILLLPVLGTMVATYAVLTHIGDAGVVQRICTSLGTPDLANCSEAVQTLSQTKQYALDYVAGFIVKYRYFAHYPIDWLLGLIPVVGGLYALAQGSRRAMLWIGGAFVVAFPLSLSLYRYGVDWGRWTQIHLMSICLLLLLADALRSREAAPSAVATERPAAATVSTYSYAVLLFLVVYATCWSMPGVKDKPLFGYMELGYRIVHWNGSLTN